ncbi:MAG: HD domain-containing protein [Oscillospiraceae bacterium]|nr:HD domain-containing protein [Oscillospiraceae bacterium]
MMKLTGLGGRSRSIGDTSSSTIPSPSSILDRAIVFATEAHRGAFRKGTGIPYILHPLEAAAIAATVTGDYEVLAAAVLHDVIEDTAVTEAELREIFGKRVAELVSVESENKRADLPAGDTWRIRKQETLDALALEVRRDVKILVLADKLSNVRSIHRDFRALGDALWERFNMKDKDQIGWYYRSIAGALESELGETLAMKEYRGLVEGTWGEF